MPTFISDKLRKNHQKNTRYFFFALLISISFASTGLYKYFESVNTEITQESLINYANIYISALEEFRNLYTTEVVQKLTANNIEISHNYKESINAVPLPATLTLMLGQKLSTNGSGASTRLYSPYPFPWRNDSSGINDDFSKEAWRILSNNPAEKFFRFEQYQGKNVLRFAKADIMQASCVSCHNNHLQSPKRNWQIGDVRGVLEVIIPLDQTLIASNASLTKLQWMMIIFSLVIFVGIFILYLKQSKTALSLQANNYLRKTVNDLNDKLSGDQEISQLSDNILDFLAKKIQIGQAALYISDNDNGFDQTSTYASPSPSAPAKKVLLGEGLVGQVAKQKQIISLEEIPENYLTISSGIGSSPPKALLIAPIIWQGNTEAIIEIASLNALTRTNISLVEELLKYIAVAIHTAKSRETTISLLDLNKRHVLELKEQHEQLQTTNINLKDQTLQLQASEEELKLSEEELIQQSDELKSNNEELEEQQELLKIQAQQLLIAQKEALDKADQLFKASQYKSEFLANMSHELRTPLNSLLILSQSLATNRTKNLNAEQVKEANIIYHSGKTLLTLINDIMDLSKVEAGKLDINIDKVFIRDIIKDLEQLFTPLAEQKQLAFAIILDSLVPDSIETDRLRLTQILKNFLGNAFKFTEQGKVELTIGFSQDNAEEQTSIIFAVKDTGIGISDEQKEDVFKAFVQANGATNRQYGGTGLGLSISTKLAHLLNSEITLDSNLGSGSTFALIVPVKFHGVDLDVIAQDRIVTKNSHQAISNISAFEQTLADENLQPNNNEVNIEPKPSTRVLLISNDIALCNKIKSHFEEYLVNIIISHSGRESIVKAEQYLPELILLDQDLADITGHQVLEQLKSNLTTRFIPVHVFFEQNEVEAMRQGAISCIKKPFNINSLDILLPNSNDTTVEEKQILVIEDDNGCQVAIQSIVSTKNTNLSFASCSSDAIKMLQDQTFDCIILDLSLPDLKGLELVQKISAQPNVGTTPIIIYTGQEISEQEQRELQTFSPSIVIKGAESPERLLDEVSLFLHQSSPDFSPIQQASLQMLHDENQMLKGCKVLVVDDDMRNVFAITSVLEDVGMQVFPAENGEAALAKIKQENDPFELILMDIMMPTMDGLKATKEIRKLEGYLAVPIIALTAKAMPDDEYQAIKAGASEYLAKPIDLSRLLSMIRVWLYKHNQTANIEGK